MSAGVHNVGGNMWSHLTLFWQVTGPKTLTLARSPHTVFSRGTNYNYLESFVAKM